MLSSRLKKTKTRGQLEELNDFNEIISDDEDDTNLNDYDVIDDGEEDVLESDTGSSEDGEAFRKLKANLDADDLHKKEYALPVEDKKKEELSDDEDGDNDGTWAISDDDTDDEDADGGGGVKLKRKGEGEADKKDGDKEGGKKRKLGASPGGKRKKRKLNEEDLGKLEEEMKVLVTKIFKKFPDGLQMVDLWRKIIASLSADADSIKKALPKVLKAIGKKVMVNGKNHYALKDKLKK